MEAIKESFKSDPIYAISMIGCGMAFFLKGIDYLLLGSPLPFAIGTLIAGGAFYVLVNKDKSSRRIVKVIAVFLILWGVTRLGIEILFSFASLTEAHIRSQFTWVNKLFSLSAIWFGIYFYRKLKNIRSLSAGKHV
ncbi:hypothetical protein [Ekhidna sp.]|uniref:hypothetical protein n=1 Tax=Ekhidna sp. TaxID=2608089 RepID=UPI00329A54D1